MSEREAAARHFSSGPEAPAELYRDPHWFACRTRHRSERKVSELLTGGGIETYLPLVERERRWSDRKTRVGFPLFPGYVFARFALGRIHEVLRLPAVSTVVRPNGYPTPVRPEELESVRRMTEGVNETGTVPTPEDYLTPGVEVVVIDGPFEGMRGILLESKGHSRVAIRIRALRQATSVEVPRGTVAPAQPMAT